MTDLAPGGATTRSCPSCGDQNPLGARTCSRCGAELGGAAGRDAERDDLETIEVERAVGAAGFDVVFAVDGRVLTCPECGHSFRLEDTRVHESLPATDTATSTSEAAVVTCNCPACHAAGHAVLGLPDSPAESPAAPQNHGTQ